MLTPSLVQVTYVAGPPVVLKVRLNISGSSVITENSIVLPMPGPGTTTDIEPDEYAYVHGMFLLNNYHYCNNACYNSYCSALLYAQSSTSVNYECATYRVN